MRCPSMMGPQQVRGPNGCVVLGENVSRPEKTAIPHGGCGIAPHGSVRPSPYEPCSLYEELAVNKSAEDNNGAGALQEFTRLSPSSLARYQMYLSRTEDSTSSVEEVVRTRSGRTLRMRPTRCRLQERPRKKRHVLQSMARPLKKWLIRHRDKPYPSKAEKLALALGSHMTLEQVSNWFANARRRLKNTVYVPGMNWGDRIRHYNNFISGNTEPLSISSDDSIWDSESEQRDADVTDDHSTRPGATHERCLNARVELFEHSYSSPARHKDEAVDDRPSVAAVAVPTRVAPKRPRCTDWESVSSKRARPSCDTDGPSEDTEDDSDDTTSFGCSDGARQPPPPLRRPLASPAPAGTPSAGSKRRLPDSDESSPPCKKYKTRMLLRYIGADLRGTNGEPVPATEARKQHPVSRPTPSKRPREEKPPAANGAKKATREGQRQTAKKRKCGAETFSGSGLRWTEIEAAEALTHLSQSSALCWQQQQQQPHHQQQQRVA